MKRFTVITGVFFLLITSFANAQDIFKQHGFNQKPLTLSNGHYNEFFNNDEIVQIGTVLLNTQTNQIIAFVDEDTAKARYLAELPSRWISPDPLAAKYPQVCPYVYTLNNPIRFIDPDGKVVVDPKGNPITYSPKTGWSSNATQDVIRIGNAMMATRTGQKQWDAMNNAAHPITLTISSEDKTVTNANGKKSYLLGITHNNVSVDKKTCEAKVTKSDIVIYEGTLNSYINNTKKSTNEQAQSYQNNTQNNDERIGAIAGHESVHATDQDNIQQSSDNRQNGANNDVEVQPVKTELQILDETGTNNMKPLESKGLEQTEQKIIIK